MELYRENPRYVAFRGKPRVLVGSGEHYGAVLNRDFDYKVYLETLGREGLDQTRAFSGVYREVPGEFGITDNTLAPVPGRFVSPWVEVSPGKFDLSRWNDAYFARLKDYLTVAGRNGVIVEFVLFCFWYNDNLWRQSPMHPASNMQGVGPTDRDAFYDPNGPLMPYQEAFVRKVVTELNGFDNVYFEICNEPYSHHDHQDFLPWQARIATVIDEMERGLPNRHLTALNVQNRTRRVTDLPPSVDIINFHYAIPEAVHLNYHLNRVLADDETGFAGQSADPYRREAWRFLLSGGSIFSHLDYSFTTRHPDGTAPIEGKTPGYGSRELRMQFAFLKRFLEEIEVWALAPHNEIFGSPAGAVLAIPGRRYAIWAGDRPGDGQIRLGIAAGTYTVRWLDPIACREAGTSSVTHPGSHLTLTAPEGLTEVVLSLTRTERA